MCDGDKVVGTLGSSMDDMTRMWVCPCVAMRMLGAAMRMLSGGRGAMQHMGHCRVKCCID